MMMIIIMTIMMMMMYCKKYEMAIVLLSSFVNLMVCTFLKPIASVYVAYAHAIVSDLSFCNDKYTNFNIHNIS